MNLTGIYVTYKPISHYSRQIILSFDTNEDLILYWDDNGKVFMRLIDTSVKTIGTDFAKKMESYKIEFANKVIHLEWSDMLDEMDVFQATKKTGMPVLISETDANKPKTTSRRKTKEK